MTTAYLSKSALIEGQYRYLLDRWWDSDIRSTGFCLWIMLNPSTADGKQDDPTIRKCVGFARRWGFNGVKIVNLFAYRATDPKALKAAGYPIGVGNDRMIAEQCHMARGTVLAWGAHAPEARARDVAALVRANLAQSIYPLYTLGVTKDGQPRHPLMVPYSTERQVVAR